MNGLDGGQQLSTEPDCCAHGEATFRLTAAKFGKIAALKVHHNVVEPFVSTTADEPTNVILTYNSETIHQPHWQRSGQLVIMQNADLYSA